MPGLPSAEPAVRPFGRLTASALHKRQSRVPAVADLAPTTSEERRSSPAAPPQPAAPQAAAGPGSAADPAAGSKRRRRILIAAIILLALVLLGAVYWFFTRNLVSTDDATIDGDAVRIAPRVAGPVIVLTVSDN